MNKAYRQGQILKLIRARAVHTQEDLARELRDTLAIPATQVTLSRDIRELGLVKTADGYRQGAVRSGPDLAEVAAEFLEDVRQAQNLIVLKTAPGHANALAVAIDAEDSPEVVGTLAGDDTVLLIAPDTETASLLRQRFLGYAAAE
ncbi:MAG: ArgR family transcriptional regulator [Bryobacteraceae bacterium]|jgi:transcriptional regulator of arginine metabolism